MAQPIQTFSISAPGFFGLNTQDSPLDLASGFALVERGEDGGLSSSEAYQLYRSMLSDYISMEATRYPEFGTFEAV